MLTRRVTQCLASYTGVVRWKHTDLGISVATQKEQQYTLKRQFQHTKIKNLERNKEAVRLHSVEFGDENDRFDADLYNLWEKLSQYSNKSDPSSVGGLYCQKLKSVAVVHLKMKYLAAKMDVDPALLRGPQLKYHPHMEIRLIDRFEKDRLGRSELIWNKGRYVRMKQAEHAYTMGNRYDSYYVFKHEMKKNHRLAHSRNNKFYKWVYYNTDTGEPYELHGKAAAEKHRWDELRDERNAVLREMELSDILKYKLAIEALDIPPVYIPTFRLPKPKWFRNNSISLLSEADVKRLQEKKKHGAVSTEEEEEDVVIPKRPTKFNESIVGWGLTDQNKYLGCDFHHVHTISRTDPIPLPAGTHKLLDTDTTPK